MSTFEQTLIQAGLRPRAMVADGRIRRCATDGKPTKRNGWYVLRPDGTGAWGDWSVGSGEALGHYGQESTQIRLPTAEELAERERRKQAERNVRLKAIRGARAFWDQSQRAKALHPYIERKGLSAMGTTGLRTHGELLVVPVLWRDRLVSVQTITADGQKRFWPGAPVKGGSLVLDRPRAALTAICEGLATGMAIYQCVRMARVVVAFDAGNLIQVVDQLRPTGSVVVVCDNDHSTMAKRGFNPGVEKGSNAANLIGAGIWWPTDIEGSDAADYLAEIGHGAARSMERKILAAAKYVVSA